MCLRGSYSKFVLGRIFAKGTIELQKISLWFFLRVGEVMCACMCIYMYNFCEFWSLFDCNNSKHIFCIMAIKMKYYYKWACVDQYQCIFCNIFWDLNSLLSSLEVYIPIKDFISLTENNLDLLQSYSLCYYVIKLYICCQRI